MLALPVAEEDEVPVEEAAFEEPEGYDYDPQGEPPDPEDSWSAAAELPEANRERLMRDVPRALRQQVRKRTLG